MNEQIERVRREVEELMSVPEFEEMSRTFKHALAQRLGLEDFKEGGLVLQAPAPVKMTDILKEAGIADVERLRDQDTPYSYGNIYTYHFW